MEYVQHLFDQLLVDELAELAVLLATDVGFAPLLQSRFPPLQVAILVVVELTFYLIHRIAV